MFGCENKLDVAIEVELDLSRTSFSLVSNHVPHVKRKVGPKSYAVLAHIRKDDKTLTTTPSADEEKLEVDFKHRRVLLIE